MTLKVHGSGRITVNTEVTSDKPAAPGRMTLRVEKFTVAATGPESKNPGTQYLKGQLRVVDGPDAGKAVFSNFMTEGAGRFRFEHLCRAVGLAGHEDLDVEDFYGREFEADISHRTYQGRTYAEIDKIFYEEADDDDEPVAAAAGNGAAAAGAAKQDFPF